MLVPKLWTTLRTYDRHQFARDALAGVVVGVVALPLAIAFGIASGVSPDRGLWTAIIAGFLVSALGGSRVQIGGPTGAFIPIVYGIVQVHGTDGLAIATIMAGVMVVVFGLARLGGVIKFIPAPVVTGFTSGIAVIIFSSQIKDLFGLEMGTVPAEFLAKWREFGAHASSADPAAIGLAVFTLVVIWLWPRITGRLPGPFVALIAATAAARLLSLDVETIGSRFGALNTAIPHPHVPAVTMERLRVLSGPAFTIALLASIESLLSAVVADGMTGGRHRSNMELVAQGAANIVAPLFGGIPATGAIARTATNIKNGGRTPVAGIVHAITLLLITLFLGRWAALIPLAALAAILVVVAYHMSEWHTFLGDLRAPKSDVAVLLVTFGLTVLVDLTVAIEVGLVLAAFLFIRRMAEVSNVSAVTRELEEGADRYESDPNGVRRRVVPEGVEVYEVSGPFFFGAVASFKDLLGTVGRLPKVLIIRLRDVPVIDASGLRALEDVVLRSRKERTVVLLSDIHVQPMVALTGTRAMAAIGEQNLFGNIDDALNRAREILGLDRVAAPAGTTPTVKRETPPEGLRAVTDL